MSRNPPSPSQPGSRVPASLHPAAAMPSSSCERAPPVPAWKACAGRAVVDLDRGDPSAGTRRALPPGAPRLSPDVLERHITNLIERPSSKGSASASRFPNSRDARALEVPARELELRRLDVDPVKRTPGNSCPSTASTAPTPGTRPRAVEFRVAARFRRRSVGGASARLAQRAAAARACRSRGRTRDSRSLSLERLEPLETLGGP